jgi:Fur family ferric uptake transcriptional regulator
VDLFEIVRQQRPKISLGTVYRNLDLLAAAGVIQKLDSGSSQGRFDGNAKPHCHVRCTHCDRIDDVHTLPSEPFGKELGPLNGYEVLGYRLEFFGLCPECSKQAPVEEDWPVCF